MMLFFESIVYRIKKIINYSKVKKRVKLGNWILSIEWVNANDKTIKRKNGTKNETKRLSKLGEEIAAKIRLERL